MDTKELSRYLHDDVLAPLLRELLDYPGEMEIGLVHSERTIAFSISTAPSDRGKLIGIKGRNVEAIRTLCGAISARYGFKFHLEVVGAARRE